MVTDNSSPGVKQQEPEPDLLHVGLRNAEVETAWRRCLI